MFQRLISNGHTHAAILDYPYTLFFAYLHEVSSYKHEDFKSLVAAVTAGSRGDSKLIKSLLD